MENKNNQAEELLPDLRDWLSPHFEQQFEERQRESREIRERAERHLENSRRLRALLKR
jgi:hypothetical protein